VSEKKNQRPFISLCIFYKAPESNRFRLLARNGRYKHPHEEGAKAKEGNRSGLEISLNSWQKSFRLPLLPFAKFLF